MPVRFVCCLVPLALAGTLAAAQPAAADSTAALPRLTVGLRTASRTTYLMRAPLPADDQGLLGPALSYQAPSGFLAAGYLNHSYNSETLREPYFNYGELTAGWQATGDADTYWTVQYTRLLSVGDSHLVQGALRNNFSANVTQFSDYLTAGLSADAFFGGTSDLVLTLDVRHAFDLPVPGERTTLTLEPTVAFAAGSQRFYAASLGRTQVVKKRRTTTAVFREPATPGFSALGYLFSAPLSLQAGRLGVLATPSYLLPLNLPADGLSGGFFFLTLEVSRTFW